MDQNKRYNTILFDWDGTLARTIPVWEEAFKTVFFSLHMPINIDDATEKLWLDSEILTELGIEHDGFFDLVYEQLSKRFIQTALYDGAKEALVKIREQGITLALVTCTRRKPILEALVYHQLEPYFETVVASEDVNLHKPNPEPYQRALAVLSVPKESTLIVGDSKFDLICAKNAGLDSTLFLPKENETYYNEEEMRSLGPKYVISNYSELIDLITN